MQLLRKFEKSSFSRVRELISSMSKIHSDLNGLCTSWKGEVRRHDAARLSE